MKKLVWLGVLVISIGLLMVRCDSGFAQAGMVKASWNANTESDLAGYKLYYDTEPRTQQHYGYKNSIVINLDTTQTLPIPIGVVHYFAVTAFDKAGNESMYSDEVSYLIEIADVTPPAKPTGLMITSDKSGVKVTKVK